MNKTPSLTRKLVMLVAVLASPACACAEIRQPVVERDIPIADGLGNVYTEGQTVTVPASPEAARRWRVLDDRAVEIASGAIDTTSERIELGQLGIGWYRVEFLGADGERVAWTTAAVLAKLAAPTPQDSPICVDSATAWFAKDDPATQTRLTRLAALTGVNWVRDRMKWREIQPQADRFAEDTTYDSSADIQTQHGLKVLQVFHDTATWAAENDESRGRYPPDLRHAYRFCKAMAERFKGRVHAWEPWNEGNVSNFGAHTADEMCTYQKAAYLGFKAGDPDVIVGWNVSTATPTKLHTRIVLANETWSYFDTYNTHTYDWPDSYERLWGPVHEAASGRPIWITESDRGLAYDTPEPWCDFSHAKGIQKAEFMAQSYATSLFAGADRHFHFVLGHYCEGGKIQFGLLRLDLTPQPSYVALAAIGRLLAGAECLGRWKLDSQPHTHIYAFQAEPDGQTRDVLVAWAERPADWDRRSKTTVEWALPQNVKVDRVLDYLGRPLGSAVPRQLKSKPIFVLLQPGAAEKLPLQRPHRSKHRPGAPCPIVLQLQMPRSATVNVKQIPWASDHAHQIAPDTEMALRLYVYNFSDQPVAGDITVAHAPAGWKLAPRTWHVTLEPMAREALPCQFLMPRREFSKTSDNWIQLRGDFGATGRPVLTFRLISKPGEGYEAGLP